MSPFLVKELTKQGVKKTVLGSASAPEALAYIYTERVTALAAERRMDERILLGLVIAHEVGHLLLPGKGHARTGIMTEGIDTDPLGLRPRFTPPEGRAIRAFLNAKVIAPLQRAANPPGGYPPPERGFEIYLEPTGRFGAERRPADRLEPAIAASIRVTARNISVDGGRSGEAPSRASKARKPY